MYISAIGKNFPLRYTVDVQSKIAKKAGRLEDLQNLFDDEDAAKVAENTVWMLSIMMQASVDTEKVKCRMLGEEYRGEEAPSYEELRMLLNPFEIQKDAMGEIEAAMNAGQKTTVEVKEEKGKNAKATQ